MKHARWAAGPRFSVKLLVFVIVALCVLAIDRISKLLANAVDVGEVLVDDIAGLLDFRLVHNTGAAWGIFSDSTFLLGIFSLVVCLVILVLFFTYVRKEGSLFQVFSLALVFAGGLGNAIDRLSYGYVIDFINTKFMSFPVFNVADIGVTVGIVLFFVASLVQEKRRAKHLALRSSTADVGTGMGE